jgi:hypothetical protein
MKMRLLATIPTVVLAACTAEVPHDLARTVLMEELPRVDGIAQGLLACVAIESRDADSQTISALQNAGVAAVPVSECEWRMDDRGSFHRSSGRKAMLVNVHGYKRIGTVELEARHHGRYATMKALEVTRGSGGWKIVKTLKHEMASRPV